MTTFALLHGTWGVPALWAVVARHLLFHGDRAIVVDLPTALYISAVEIEGSSVIGQFPADAGGSTDNFGLLFEKDNKLVGCVNKALAALKDSGSLAEITNKWLSENVGAPVISVG